MLQSLTKKQLRALSGRDTEHDPLTKESTGYLTDQNHEHRHMTKMHKLKKSIAPSFSLAKHKKV